MIPFFTPRYLKKAKLLSKGVKRWLHYKEDLLSSEQLATVRRLGEDLKSAIKAKDKEQVKSVSTKLADTCSEAVPPSEHSKIGENVEVIFVALVVVFGFKAFFLKPFRIPTGSMQPTLNGVICKAQDKDEFPNPIVRVAELALRGRSYVYKEAKKDLIIPADMTDFVTQNGGFWKRLQTFHTVSQIHFENATISCHGVPMNDLLQNPEIELGRVIREKSIVQPNGTRVIPKGTVLYSGYADSGDLIIADKVSYHFRKPKRGETFIFDTRGIKTNGSRSRLNAQEGATHYIKRCVGVPGDSLQIESPYLLVNGEKAKEQYIQRVANAEGVYEGLGYVNTGRPGSPLAGPDNVLNLKLDEKEWYHSEYAAMGDNTENSLDSRYWGALEEYNVVAPAFFTLWPITTGHWGLIK